MDFPLVIKVKYGDTLRRFTASVGESGLLNLDMARLINQIRALFSFPPNADLTLTYTDEDSDDVALVDDKDLYDATRQKLNPLRIQVVKNRIISSAIFNFTSQNHHVPIPIPTDLQIHHPQFEPSYDLQKADAHFVATNTKETLPEMEENLDKLLNDKSTEDESFKSTYSPYDPIQPRKMNSLVSAKSAARMELDVDVDKPIPTDQVDVEGSKADSEMPPSVEVPLEAHDIATKIKIMEAMSKMGGNSDKLKSVANENSKPTDKLSSHSFPCPGLPLKTHVPVSAHLLGPSKSFNDVDACSLSLAAETCQVLKAPHTCTDGLTETQSMLTQTGQVEQGSEAVNSNTAIEKGKNDSCIVDGHVSVGVSPVVPVLVSDPVTESSLLQSEPSTATGADNCFLEVDVDVDYEGMLLYALEQMGFKQIDINKEILRKNLYDLNQSITDLCDLGEWDEVLSQLEQMGFCDKVSNIELLKKKEGNIKDVVMTLISEEEETE